MIQQILILVLSALISLMSVNWIFFKILVIAKLKELVDNPNARKLQKIPVPVLGGLAVFFGLLMGMAGYVALSKLFDMPVISYGISLLPVVLCTSVMLYVGSIDDILGLTPKIRIVIEVLTMLMLIFGTGLCVDSLHGLWGVENFSWWIAVPLTVFAGVGIINAYNMVDGVNGLSSSLCITCSVILSVICFKRADYANCALAICFAASLIPFLLHNVFGKWSKMFIGDGGTMMMGLLVSWFMIRLLSNENASSLTMLADGPERQLGLIPMMLAVAALPVFDTLRVMTTRMVKKKSPFHPDRTHLHHAFIDVGVSHSITALSETMINVLVCGVWYLTYRMGASIEVQLYVVIGMAMILVWGTYFLLNHVAREHPNSYIIKIARSTHIGHTKWWLAFQRKLDKGVFEYYSHILNKKPEEMNYKELDTMAIVNYLQGKNSVKVSDIIAEAGIEKLRVYPILIELEQDGIIIVSQSAPLGAPEVVSLDERAL